MAVKKKSSKKKAPSKKKSSLKNTATTLKKKLKALVKKSTAIIKGPLVKSGLPKARLPLNIETESLPTFFVGQSRKVKIEASGGIQPYKWQLAQGTLPPGLKFNSLGILYGRARQAGYPTIWIKVTDSSRPTKLSRTQAYDMQIEQP